MFSEEMSLAVQSAQKMLDLCCSSGNILLTATMDVSRLNSIVKKIDPTDIDFRKSGLLHRSRINSYWNLYEAAYQDLEDLVQKLSKDQKIIANTLKTIQFECKNYSQTISMFRKINKEDDTEYLQQLTVAQNMEQLLLNTEREYFALQKTINSVSTILKQSIDIAVYIARTYSGRDIAFSKTASHCTYSCEDYKKSFTRLKSSISSYS